ncbi:MAG TPA: metallophosphoesterase [Rhodothermales bacterium]
MNRCFFVSDLHGRRERYEKLFRATMEEKPPAMFLGGDLLPSPWIEDSGDSFLLGYLGPKLRRLRTEMGDAYPTVLVIFGNDDEKQEERPLLELAEEGLILYAHDRSHLVGDWTIVGYSYVPPTPFLLKDWEKYDVGRYVPPGCVSPEEGRRTVTVPERDLRYGTIQQDLERLFGDEAMDRTIILFHGPPYDTKLDRADLDDISVDYAPLDVHIGSVALRRFIESRQPHITLHGHVHESARLTGDWRQRLGRTYLFGAAHDGLELALLRLDLDAPENSTRQLV